MKTKIIDLVVGIVIYLLLSFVFGWGTPGASNSYLKNYNYGFPSPIVVKEVPTNFCPSTFCDERPVSYHLYDSFTAISPLLVYSIIADLVVLLSVTVVVSYARRKVFKR